MALTEDRRAEAMDLSVCGQWSSEEADSTELGREELAFMVMQLSVQVEADPYLTP